MHNLHVTLCISRWKHLSACVCVPRALCTGPSAQCSEDLGGSKLVQRGGLCRGEPFLTSRPVPHLALATKRVRVAGVAVTNICVLVWRNAAPDRRSPGLTVARRSTARSGAGNPNGAAGRRSKAGSDQTARCATSRTARRRRLPHWMSLAGCLPWDFRRSCLLIRNAGRASKHAEHEWSSHPGEKRKRARPLWTKVCAVAVVEMRAWLFRHLFKFSVGITDEQLVAMNYREKSMTNWRASCKREAKQFVDLHITKEGSCTRALSGNSSRVGDAQANKTLEKQCVSIKNPCWTSRVAVWKDTTRQREIVERTRTRKDTVECVLRDRL